MLNIFKEFDLISEMDKHIKEDEDIFVECRPNKIPFLTRRMWQPILATIGGIILTILYVAVRSLLDIVLQNLFDFIFIFGWIGIIAFIFIELYNGILDTKTNYYVVTTDGVHILYFSKTLAYKYIRYIDMKSVVLKTGSFGVGDIYIKEKYEKVPKTLLEKFMYKREGLIGIDQADKVFEVIKTIAIQDNDNIFFADSNELDPEVEYFKKVQKFDRKLDVKKDESLVERRNNSNK